MSRKYFFLGCTILVSLFYLFSHKVLSYSYYDYNTGEFKHAGGFFTLSGAGGGFSARRFVNAGSTILDWRDFEPVEGQYHWELLEDGTFNHWKSYNDCKCDNPAPIMTPGQAFSLASSGKTVRFKLRITDGAVPLWLFGGQGRKEGLSSSSYGYVCAQKQYYADFDCKGVDETRNYLENDIVIANPYPPFPDKEDAVHPVWWNPIFQEKLRRVLIDLGQRVESDQRLKDGIEFVEASVGNFGEMILYGKGDYNEDGSFNYDSFGVRHWKAAGYTNARYTEAVLKILGFYMEAFPNLPIALSVGSGLYPGGQGYDDGSGVVQVEKTVVDEAMRRWGGRLYLKFAGFAGGSKGGLFREYCPALTKCVYETFGGITQWIIDGLPWSEWKNQPAKFEKVLKWAVDDRAYLVGMWQADWTEITNHDAGVPAEQDLEPVLDNYGYRLQPQIAMREGNNGVSFNTRNLPAGSPITITTKWRNYFNYISLSKPKRIFNIETGTYKDIPSSYPIYFDLVNNSGNIVFKTAYIPSIGTHTWTSGAVDIDTSDQVFIPWNIPPGEYTPRVAIVIDEALTKFWNIGGRGEDPPHPILDKKITITAPATNPLSFKLGWNKITWPSVSGLTTEQIQSACQIFAKNGFGESAFVKDFSVMPLTFLSGEGLFFKCRQALW